MCVCVSEREFVCVCVREQECVNLSAEAFYNSEPLGHVGHRAARKAFKHTPCIVIRQEGMENDSALSNEFQ